MENLINQPKTKRGEATLEKILEAAEQLFYEKGYHGTNIVDITQKAGIALGTFYIYFKDKYSLYKYLLGCYSHQIRKAISLSAQSVDNRRDMERIGLKTFLKFTRDNKHAYNIIWESLYINKELFIEYYESFAHRYLTGLKKAQQDGEVYSDIDPEIASYFLMGVSNFVGLKYVMFDEDFDDFDRVVDQVMSLLDRGMFIGGKDK